MPKPYKPSAGDRNEKSGGDQEMKNRKYKASDALIPGVDYSREMNTYMSKRDSQGRSYTPRNNPGFSPKRNDKDLAAQSAVDEAIAGIKPKRHGGGPGQRPGINMINNLRYAKGGKVKMASGGMTFGVNTKELPSSNYPLRKVNAFVRKTTPKFLRPLHDMVDKPILNALEPVSEAYLPDAAQKPVAGSVEATMKKAMNQNRNNVAPSPTGMKRGGSVKGDGCCTKGKTKGRFV